MSTQPDEPIPTIRDATEGDIPAIVSLVLTSFRQFPLFAFLYNPLYNNKDAARDTIFFWSRRVLIDLLDPTTTVQVAELANDILPTARAADQSDDPIAEESWRMLEWLQRNSRLSQASKSSPGAIIVGFTIWKDRPGVDESAAREDPVPQATWMSMLRTTLLNLETNIWSRLYKRKDQDVASYQEYEAAEDKLEKDFYQEPCFYLDNLCVDFRCQRMGIGTLLLENGIDIARQKKLAVGTEASVKGIGLYTKLGFEKVGTWKVGQFEVPVMRLPAP
jgi:ribosomal protein S18 acetylase RimI-like enzyme